MSGVVYLVNAYNAPEQLGRLVRRIRAESDGRVLVHIDGKFDDAPFREACDGTAAEFLEQRQAVTYAAFSLVRATMLLAAAALTGDFAHAVLMSGQDYPIKPLATLEGFLAEREDLDFLNVKRVDRELPELVDRYERFHFPDWPDWAPKWKAKNALAVARRRPPRGVTVFGGSAWWALSRASVETVVGTYRSDRALRRFFSHTSTPEEHYVHTVLGNARRRECIRPTITYFRFDPAVSRQHPLVWTVDDIAELEASDAFLARKFDLTVDSRVLDHFDRRTIDARDDRGGVPGPA